MKNLTDAREPITLADIDEAIADGRAWLDANDAELDPEYLVRRLLAIVEDTYGQDHGPQFRTED